VVFSAGGVLGALVYSAIGTRLPRRPVFVVGLFAAAAVAGVFAYSPPFWVQLLAMAVGGFMTGPVNPIVNVVLQERTHEEIRGRALSMVFAFAYALFPLGYIAAGFMVKGIGAEQTFSVMAFGSALVAVWAMITPALRGMNGPPESPDVTAQEG
jgi:MFS family permease